MKRVCRVVIVLVMAVWSAGAATKSKIADDPRVKTAVEAARIWLEAQRLRTNPWRLSGYRL